MLEQNAYAILNLRKGADDKSIKKAYVEMVKRYNPEEHTDRFVAIKAAYDQLRDPSKRAAADCFTFNYVSPTFHFSREERAKVPELELMQQEKSAKATLQDNPRDAAAIASMVKIHMLRSWQNLNQKKYREAIREWELVLDLDPDNRRAKNNLNFTHVYLGYFYAENELFEDAIDCWEKALKINPDNVDVLHNIALAAERINNYQKAGEFWNRTLKRWQSRLDEDPADEYIKQCIIEVKKKRGDAALNSETDDAANGSSPPRDTKAAEKEWSDIAKLDPNDAGAQRKLAMAHLENKEFQKAIEVLNNLRKTNPRDSEVLNLLGQAMLNNGQVNEAFNVWRQSQKVDPKNQQTKEYMIKAHLSVGKRLRETNQFTQALVHFKHLEKLLPRSEELYMELASTYLMKGDKNSAKKQFERVLKLNPSNKAASKAMSELRLRG